MANNRMYLVNTRTGEILCIAKYYPSTGWYVANPEKLAERIDAAFHTADFPDSSWEEVEAKKLIAAGGLWGDCSWMIQYESVDEESNDAVSQAKIRIIKAMQKRNA